MPIDPKVLAQIAGARTKAVVHRQKDSPYKGAVNDPYEGVTPLIQSTPTSAYVDRGADQWKIIAEDSRRLRQFPSIAGQNFMPADYVLREGFGIDHLPYELTQKEWNYFGQAYMDHTVQASYGGFIRHEKVSDWEVIALKVIITSDQTTNLLAIFHPEDDDMIKFQFGRHTRIGKATSKEFVDMVITAGTLFGQLDIG